MFQQATMVLCRRVTNKVDKGQCYRRRVVAVAVAVIQIQRQN